jgi:hypothetical protein
MIPAAAVIITAALLLSACAHGARQELAEGAPPPGVLSPLAVAECAWVDANADYPAEVSGSVTPRLAVESWLAEQDADVHAAVTSQDADGLRYIDADGHLVGEFSVTQADDGTWLLSAASVCATSLQRR